VKIRARVIPNSKLEGVVKQNDGFLVRVKEPAREGRANRAVIKLLAEHFGVSQRQIVISSGFGSRNKVIEVLDIQ
jgi:uncharacterized protein (TIGR00251 family)